MTFVLLSIAVILLAPAAASYFLFSWRHVVHRVEVRGCPGYFVEFVADRSLLSVNTGPGYVIVFPGGGEDKHTIPFDVPLEELRRDSWAEYDGASFTVHAPRRGNMTLPGWRP